MSVVCVCVFHPFWVVFGSWQRLARPTRKAGILRHFEAFRDHPHGIEPWISRGKCVGKRKEVVRLGGVFLRLSWLIRAQFLNQQTLIFKNLEKYDD